MKVPLRGSLMTTMTTLPAEAEAEAVLYDMFVKILKQRGYK